MIGCMYGREAQGQGFPTPGRPAVRLVGWLPLPRISQSMLRMVVLLKAPEHVWLPSPKEITKSYNIM